MLQSTFQHIRGIGKKTEMLLWEKGITSWNKYIKSNGHQQLKLFENDKTSPVYQSLQAYEKGDLHYFADRLAKSENYRIVLTYPENTLFLDIETTGLSLYYDQITMVGWSIGRKYGVYLKDQDESGLREALKAAKTIVTFNGTIFDIKFLVKTFPDIVIPPIHVDLRFLAKRVGLTGGQKANEPIVGYHRPDLISGMEGETAPILWYKYRRGDKSALKELVTYNHADIEGMKWILDYAIQKIYELNAIPNQIRSQFKFTSLQSEIDWANRKPINSNPYKVYLKKFSGHLKPLIKYSELNEIVPLSDQTIIGIDIVSSEDRESGYCILKGNKAETCRIKTDYEMIRLAQDAGATLISIDSPLSIPKGRTSYFDDDPVRDKYGIMRVCERILKKRGVNVYPCLIPSMQKLTRRGIQLADKFRGLGIPVIESYPGAAQDIMAIPRKRAGLKYLADALVEFGIYDNFTQKNISHDELDAITSAIVGIFFWTGKFEGIGTVDEEYLIIPDLHINEENWLSRKVIGLSGLPGSGKSTIAGYLVKHGFKAMRFSAVLESILAKKGEKIIRSTLQQLGNEINSSQKQRWLGKEVIKKLPYKGPIVIDGLRFPEDHSIMIETFGPAFHHIFIESPLDAIGNRIADSLKEDIPLETTLANPVESQINRLKKLSHKTIFNYGNITDLYKKIDTELEF